MRGETFSFFRFLMPWIAGVSASLIAASPPTLQELAKHRIYIGAFGEYEPMMREPLYGQTLGREFNAMTIGVYLAETQPTEESFAFERADALLSFALRHGMSVRVSPVVWGNQSDTIPKWLEAYANQPEKLEQVLKARVQTIVRHFRDRAGDRVIAYDIVNEPLENLGSAFHKNIWSGTHPENPTRYIADAFQWAHEADPRAKLFLNEIFLERSGAKFATFLGLIRELQREAVAITGVGMQMHQFLPFGALSDIDLPGEGMALAASPERIEKRLSALQGLGLEDVHLSEMDIPVVEPHTPFPWLNRRILEGQLSRQADLYRGYVDACLHIPVCKAVVFWGVSDRDSWIPRFFPGFGHALLFDDAFQPKPAYFGVRDALLTR